MAARVSGDGLKGRRNTVGIAHCMIGLGSESSRKSLRGWKKRWTLCVDLQSRVWRCVGRSESGFFSLMSSPCVISPMVYGSSPTSTIATAWGTLDDFPKQTRLPRKASNTALAQYGANDERCRVRVDRKLAGRWRRLIGCTAGKLRLRLRPYAPVAGKQNGQQLSEMPNVNIVNAAHGILNTDLAYHKVRSASRHAVHRNQRAVLFSTWQP